MEIARLRLNSREMRNAPSRMWTMLNLPAAATIAGCLTSTTRSMSSSPTWSLSGAGPHSASEPPRPASDDCWTNFIAYCPGGATLLAGDQEPICPARFLASLIARLQHAIRKCAATMDAEPAPARGKRHAEGVLYSHNGLARLLQKSRLDPVKWFFRPLRRWIIPATSSRRTRHQFARANRHFARSRREPHHADAHAAPSGRIVEAFHARPGVRGAQILTHCSQHELMAACSVSPARAGHHIDRSAEMLQDSAVCSTPPADRTEAARDDIQQRTMRFEFDGDCVSGKSG